MDHFVEQVQESTAFGTEPAGEFLAPFGAFFTSTLVAMIGLTIVTRCDSKQVADLVADRPQRAVLDFDQPSAGDRVDPIARQGNLVLGLAAGVEQLEIAVEGGFHEGRTSTK